MRILPLLAILLAATADAQSATPAAASTASIATPTPPTPTTTPGSSGDAHAIVAYTPSSASPDLAAIPPDSKLLTPTPAHTRFGLMFDVGAPDGGALSLVYRPWKFLRVNGGGSYDVLGFGVRGGASLVPFYFAVTPSLNFDIGHYFASDITSVAHKLTNVSGDFDPILRALGFSYLNAHLGLEFGSPRRFVFFVHAGYSKAWTSRDGVYQLGSNVQLTDPQFRGTFPSAKLGFIVYAY